MTSLHVRAAAILAGDLPPDIRSVIEELMAAIELDREDDLARDLDPAPELVPPGWGLPAPQGNVVVVTDGDGIFNGWLSLMSAPAEPASPSTDSEAGQ